MEKQYTDFLMSLSEELVCWYHADENINSGGYQRLWGSRNTMLRNLLRIGGVAIFIENLESQGIASEYDIATRYVKGLDMVVNL